MIVGVAAPLVTNDNEFVPVAAMVLLPLLLRFRMFNSIAPVMSSVLVNPPVPRKSNSVDARLITGIDPVDQLVGVFQSPVVGRAVVPPGPCHWACPKAHAECMAKAAI